MNKPAHNIFHNDASLLACLSGAALLIIASDRLAHAITVAGALIWVYGLSSLAARTGARIFPRRGRTALLAFLSSFFAGIYLLLLWILSPLCALETFFVISLIPMFYMFSSLNRQLKLLSLEDIFYASLSESLMLGALLVIFALIREPLGYLSLSVPGGTRGIVLLFSFTSESFLPIHLIASSCGALLLLGYFFALYRYLRAQYAPKEGKNGY